ncbi:MAG: ribonuclease 3 [Bacteroidia bacterium]|nr:MAG: ribonuclease 3 [Bacteroidia bacterium]
MRNVVKAVLGLFVPRMSVPLPSKTSKAIDKRGKRKNGAAGFEDLPQPIREQLDFQRFQKTIGYTARNPRLFVEALLHRSYLPQLHERWNSNERLEFLGDAVLNFLVAEHLHSANPDMEEGDLTKLRSRLVNRKVLAQASRDLHLADFLLLSASAAQSLDHGSESILSDAFEAIVGALYLDGGIEGARAFVERTLLRSRTLKEALTDDNYKSALLEYAQAEGLGIPRYGILREEGPDHDRRFTIEVFVGQERCGVGIGKSKKEAEQAAAARALEHFQTKMTKS